MYVGKEGGGKNIQREKPNHVKGKSRTAIIKNKVLSIRLLKYIFSKLYGRIAHHAHNLSTLVM